MPESERSRAHSLVAALSVVTQGTIRNYAPQPGVGDGPLFPPSGFDRRDDKADSKEFHLKSHQHFVVRLKGCKTENDFGRVADDVQRALDAWKKTGPPPTDSTPWRELVAKDVNEGTMSIRKIAEKWKISPAYVFQLGQRFKNVA